MNGTQAVRRFFEQYDYFIAPTAQLFPFDVDLCWPQEIAGKKMMTYHAGCPALAVPAGFGNQGLPMGIQIVAPNHHEFACLQLAYGYESDEHASSFVDCPDASTIQTASNHLKGLLGVI